MKSIEEDPRREEARRLRVDPGLSRSQLMAHFGVGNGTLSGWLRGLDPPEWTRRPNAKDALRDRAVELRREGASVPAIATQLSVSKSTAYLWTRHVPFVLTPGQQKAREQERVARMEEVRWEPHRRARDAERLATGERLGAWVGELTDREVILIGAVAYWCEGAKEKPWTKSTEVCSSSTAILG